MHPLLAEPTDEQARLLNIIYDGREEAGRPNYKRVHAHAVERVGSPSKWPTFQYVESMLYRQHQLDARSVLATCPVIATGGGDYGWVWHQPPNPQSLAFDSTLTLTVAGMRHVPAASEEVEVFLNVLALMVSNERTYIPLAAEAREVMLSVGALQEILKQMSGEWSLDEVALDAIRDALALEPATWHSRATPDVRWSLALSPFLRDYEGVTTPDAYVQRVADLYTPTPPEPEPLYPSALSLPEAVDYLNAIWRLHAGRPLMRIGRAEAAAKLVLDCANADEFDSRLSALCSILDGLDIPDRDGHKLADLAADLRDKLGEELAGRAIDAIDSLRALFDLRVWRQHAGTERRTAGGMNRLGITLPVTDWAGTWQQVQARAVAALSALREEVERLDPL